MFLFVVLKKCGILIANTILFAQYYEGSHGNRYFMWREKPDSDEHLTERNGVIDSVTKMLLKYFSRAHKNKMRLLIECVMLDKISPTQFRFISKKLLETIPKLILKNKQNTTNAFAALSKTLILHYAEIYTSTTEKKTFDSFWDIAKNVIEELTAADDRRHTQGSTTSGKVVVNMAIAISARDLYDMCKNVYLKKQLPENEIPLFSWFKFQFWSKDSTTHTALNYTGRFPVKYMLQQRMIRKSHDNNHYAHAIFKYAREYAVSTRDICSFVCTDNKYKISLV